MLLDKPSANWPHPAITTHGFNNHAIRTKNWRYIRYANGDEELYNHRKDPHEWNNLASDSGVHDIKDQLRTYLPMNNAASLSKKRKP